MAITGTTHTPPKSTPIPGKTWFVIVLLNLAGHIAWNVENSWFNTFVFDTITPDPRPVAWMVAVSAITATLTTLVMGTFSDRIGKRKPFLVFGYILWGVSTALFPTTAYIQLIGLAVFMVIALDALMTFFGSTANDSVFYAWLTDITDESNRARVLGILAVIPLLVVAITAVVGGMVIDNFGYFAFFYGLGGFVLLAGLVSSPFIKESPELKPIQDGSYWQQLASVFNWRSVRENRALYLLFINMMIILIADQISMPYLFIYLENYIGISKTTIGLITLVLTLISGAIVITLSRFIDRWGRRRTAIILGFISPAGILMFSFLRSIPAFILFGAFYIAPGLLAGIVTSAWKMDLYPQGNRGQFQGIRMIFQVMIPMVVGPMIGSALIAQFGIPTTLNGEAGYIPSPHLWWANALVALLALIPLVLIRQKPTAKEHTA